MKLYRILLVVYVILFANLAYSNSEFHQLFELTKVSDSLILSNKEVIILPAKNLTPQQRLHRYISTFGNLQLYLNASKTGFHITPVYRLSLIYGSAIVVKVLHETNEDLFSLFLDSNNAEQHYSVKAVTTEQDIQKVTIAPDKKITIADILTNETSLEHIISQLEYGVFSSTSKIFLSDIYQPEYDNNLLIRLQHNELTIKLLMAPYNSQLAKCYLFTKLFTCDIKDYIIDNCKLLFNRIKAQKQQANDTK